MATAPNTLAIAQAILTYCSALTYIAGNSVYTKVQLGEIKDLSDQISQAGTACLEIYANQDHSQHFAFNGKIRDEQSWFLLSLVNLDDAQRAEETIYQVRDMLIPTFQIHATLGNAGTVFHSEVKKGSGKFLKIFRNQQWVRAHLIELLTIQEWNVPVPPGVIS